MMNYNFIRRELVHGGSQAIIFVLCVALSLVSIVVVNSFRRDIGRSLAGDAKVLHGADIIVSSPYGFSPELEAIFENSRQEFEVSKSWSFYSVVRGGQQSLLSAVKIVEPNYPLYGVVELASGQPLQDVLRPGTVVVAKSLLTRLSVNIGDLVQIGEAEFTIADTIGYDPADPVEFFKFGPRVIGLSTDLAKMDIVGRASRVKYRAAIKVVDGDVLQIEQEISKATLAGGETVETSDSASSPVKRFFDNLFFFLALISIFTLLLSGIGMQNTLTALLEKQRSSQSIIRSLGATSGFLIRHYLVVVMILGGVGCLLGLLGASALAVYLPYHFQDILPSTSDVHIGVADFVEGAVLGLLTVLFFAFLPLYRLRWVRPQMVLKGDPIPRKYDAVQIILLTTGIVVLSLLVVRQLDDLKMGLLFVGGVVVLGALVSVIVWSLLKIVQSIPTPQLAMRQAKRSLVRPGNATVAVGVTLAAALSLLLTIYLVEHNISATYIDSYPEDAPNLFLIDIQKNQLPGFLNYFEDGSAKKVDVFPVIRARLISINNVVIDREKERKRKRSDSLSREFNLTYRASLLSTEKLIAGHSLFHGEKPRDQQVAQGGEEKEYIPVSVLDTVAEIGNMHLGDILKFNIQGVPITARISSVRSQTSSKLFPFFYFVFEKKYLEKAPQTFFAALHLSTENIDPTVYGISTQYPNISAINVSEAAKTIGKVLHELVKIVRFFAAISIVAGTLIIVSSILATRMSRMREAVYYKMLGARPRFVVQVFLYESILLGVLGVLPAFIVAEGLSWWICGYIDIAFSPAWVMVATLCLGMIGLVTIVAMLSSMKIIKQKPGSFLQQEANL